MERPATICKIPEWPKDVANDVNDMFFVLKTKFIQEGFILVPT